MRTLVAFLILWAVASAGQAQTAAPTWTSNMWGTSVPGVEGQPFLLGNWPQKWDDRPTLRIDRHVPKGSGKPWYTYKGLWVLSSTNPYNQGFEWALTAEIHNNALASTGSQNVAVNGTAWKVKLPGDPAGPVGTTWAGNFNCVDQTGEVDPVGSCIGLELDVSGTGTDRNRQRVGLHIAGGGNPGAHAGYGLLISPTEGATIDRAIALQTPGASFGIGLDLAPVAFSGPAINLAPGQWLAFDGDAQGKFGRFLGFNPADGMMTYMTPWGPMLRFSDDGAAYVGRLIETIPHVPTSASSPCVAGERAWDQAYEYRCVAKDRWRRAALADW